MSLKLSCITPKKLIFAIFNILLWCTYTSTKGQVEFFKSKIDFSENQLSNFFSSFSLDSSQIFFIANDYYLYVYNKKTGKLNWSYDLSNKTNNPPRLYKNNVFVEKHFSENNNKCVQLNTNTGKDYQTLAIGRIETQPVFKGNMMYCTAIAPEIGGAVLAYDLKNNKIAWQHFIAHGVSRQPYFFTSKIIANVEGNNWFEINYNGKILDTNCKSKANLFVEDIKCIRNFTYLTHNQQEISESYFDTYESIKVKYSKDHTIVLSENIMLIINDNSEREIKLSEILPFFADEISNYSEILKIEKNFVWFVHSNILVLYDFENNKIEKSFDLTKWNVHQAILDEDNLWLISKSDGQIIGLNLSFDKRANDMLNAKRNMERKINNYKPDLKKIEAAKALENKYKKNLKK